MDQIDRVPGERVMHIPPQLPLEGCLSPLRSRHLSRGQHLLLTLTLDQSAAQPQYLGSWSQLPERTHVRMDARMDI